MLAAGMMAGLATIPLSASADTAPPQGSATASTVSLTVSLDPIASVVNGEGVLGQLSQAFETLKSALCPTASALPTGCDLTLPDSLPKSLTVHIAQANAGAAFNSAATDVVSGASDAQPVQTNWKVLNADISTLEQDLTTFIEGGANQLAQKGVAGLTNFLSSNGPGSLDISTPLGEADLNILGSVSASLNQKGVQDQAEQAANAVHIAVTNGSLPAQVQGNLVHVDPFQADALNAAAPETANHVTGPVVSAANTSVNVGLPGFTLTGVNAAGLSALSNELHSLVDALTNAIANPSSAGSILSNVSGVPAPLQSTLTTIGGLVTQTVNALPTAPVSTPIDLSTLKTWDTKLSAALDGVNAFNAALADLPDVTNLVTSTDNIATAKTAPLAGGGVQSTATANLGAISVLPVGGTLAGLLSSLPLPNKVDASNPPALLAIKGITSTATAEVGPGTGSPVGTGGIGSISILGQQIPVDTLLKLAPGTSQTTTIGIPGLGANGGVGYLTLVISEGLQQTIADSATYRAVNMAELDVELINGCPTTCTNVLPLPGTTLNMAAPRTAAAPHAASTSSGDTGIQSLGSDGDLLRLAVSDTTASASMNGQGFTPGGPGCNGTGSPTCPVSATGNLVALPKTGMFGGAALPAGLVLIAVAISLRLVPGLRTRVRRMR